MHSLSCTLMCVERMSSSVQSILDSGLQRWEQLGVTGGEALCRTARLAVLGMTVRPQPVL